jgi:hypothetical protein
MGRDSDRDRDIDRNRNKDRDRNKNRDRYVLGNGLRNGHEQLNMGVDMDKDSDMNRDTDKDIGKIESFVIRYQTAPILSLSDIEINLLELVRYQMYTFSSTKIFPVFF